MYMLLYWAYFIVCCVKRFLLMSESQKAFLYHTVTFFNITGNWIHSAVSGYLLVIIKMLYTQTVQIPHILVKLTLSIQNFNLWFWLLSKVSCMNVIFQRLITRNKRCLKTGKTWHMQDTMHPSFLYSDCDFYLYYTLVLYSLIMICIFTLFIFYQRLLCVLSFWRKTQICIFHVSKI